MLILDNEEPELLASVENGEWQTVDNIIEEKLMARETIRRYL